MADGCGVKHGVIVEPKVEVVVADGLGCLPSHVHTAVPIELSVALDDGDALLQEFFDGFCRFVGASVVGEVEMPTDGLMQLFTHLTDKVLKASQRGFSPVVYGHQYGY